MSEVSQDGNDGLHASAEQANRRNVWIAVAAVVAGVFVAIGVIYGVSSQPGGNEPAAESSAPSSASPNASATPGDASETAEPAPSDGAVSPPVAERETLEPAPFDQEAAPAEGVTVAVASIEAVQGEALAPGEVSGPALRITVKVTNSGTVARTLSSAVVNVYLGADLLAANPVSRPEGQPFPSELAPGGSADGIFVFEVAEDQRSQIRVEVDLDLATPLVIFEGAVS